MRRQKLTLTNVPVVIGFRFKDSPHGRVVGATIIVVVVVVVVVVVISRVARSINRSIETQTREVDRAKVAPDVGSGRSTGPGLVIIVVAEEGPLAESAETLRKSRRCGQTVVDGVSVRRRHETPIVETQRTHEVLVRIVVEIGRRRRLRHPVLLVVVHRDDRVDDALEGLLAERTFRLDFGPFQDAVVAELMEARVGERFVLDFFQADDAVGFRRRRAVRGRVIFAAVGGVQGILQAFVDWLLLLTRRLSGGR